MALYIKAYQAFNQIPMAQIIIEHVTIPLRIYVYSTHMIYLVGEIGFYMRLGNDNVIFFCAIDIQAKEMDLLLLYSSNQRKL